MYNTASKEILWGNGAETRQSEENHQNIFYINNIFTKLNNIYLKRKQTSSKSEYDIYDKLVLQTVPIILRRLVESAHSLPDKNRSNSLSTPYYHFTFLVPTSWDYGIREELIRPLFIQAGLITESDHKGRLLFFTKLESIFEYMQFQYCGTINKSIGNGKQYIMHELYFIGNKLSVDLDLFSAHYPPATAIDKGYVPKSLKSICFNVSLVSKLETGIESCLKNRGFDIKAIKTRKILAALINNYQNQEVSYNFSLYDDKSFTEIHVYQPFKGLLGTEEWVINENEISSIRSITLEEIHADLFISIKTAFLHQIKNLMKNTDWKTRMAITRTVSIKCILDKDLCFKLANSISWMVLSWLKPFMTIYCENQFNYKHVVGSDAVSLGVHLLPFETVLGSSIRSYDTEEGQSVLIKKQIQLSTKYMPPTIIPRSKIENSEFASMRLFVDSAPNYVINIGNKWKHITADRLLYNPLYADLFFLKTCLSKPSMFHVHL